MSAGDSNSMVFDAHSGRNVWHYQLGFSRRATVGTTYMLDGRQYLLAPAGSMLTGFALPAERGTRNPRSTPAARRKDPPGRTRTCDPRLRRPEIGYAERSTSPDWRR
jgi:hypothetical protein